MPRASDTDPRARAILIEGYRRMTPAERMRRVVSMNATLMDLARARIRARHGSGIGEREMDLRLASLWLGRGVMMKAFGWDPDVEGY